MPNKSITSFSGDYLTTDGQWPDNLVGDITAARLRAGILDTWDSFVFSDATLTSNLSTVSGIVSNHTTYISNVSGQSATTTSNLSTVSGLVSNHTTYISNVSGVASTNTTNLGTLSGIVNSGLFTTITASGLVLPKAGSTGIKVDLASPTFGWKDLVGQIVPRTGAAATPAPTLAAYRGANILSYAFDTNDVIDSITYHMPHDYLPGSDMFIHTHWGHNGTAITGVFAVTYYIEYCKGYNQASQVFNSQVTLAYSNSAVYSTTTHPRWGHFIEEVQMTSATGSASTLDRRLLEVDGPINVGFKLITKPTITGGTTSPFIFMVDIHYQTNGVIGTKDKNYPFYT